MALWTFVIAMALASDFNGQWVGKGNLTDSLGRVNSCAHVFYEIQQTANNLSIRQGSLTCNTYNMDLKPLVFVIRGGTLWRSGRPVGILSPDAFALDFFDNSGNRDLISAALVAKILQYREKFLSTQGTMIWTLQSELARK